MIPLDPSLTVSQLASTHPASVEVLQRHGIDFTGTGRASLAEVCRELSLDPIVLLAEVRAEEARVEADPPLDRLVRQMLQAYHHVLREELPRLHRMARRVIEDEAHRDPDTLTSVLDTFLELRGFLEDHGAREERELQAVAGRPRGQGPPALAFALRQEHEAMTAMLRRLRRVTRDFTPPDGAGLPWHELWRGFEGLEVSLQEHVRLVNTVLFLCTVVDEGVRPQAERVEP
ncbi:MAG: DUF542 domain-containing protein [Planctomycetes bacterium]|nr:DUF542 domain-containing protein [Planctomycetota bacterium]